MPRKKSNLDNSSLSRASATRIVERDQGTANLLSSPIVICGFVGPGLAGLTAVGYIIEHLGLHEAGEFSFQA